MMMEPSKVDTGALTIPNLLSSLRLALLPVMFYAVWTEKTMLYVSSLSISLFSDFADGFMARKLNQASELGSKLDSWADFAMYVSIPICAWWLWPELIRREAVFVIILVTSYLTPAFFGVVKYGRLTSYHTRGAKVSAILMGSAILVLFAWGPAWPLRLFTPVFVLSAIEEIAMTVILPEWRANVPSLWHAVKLLKKVERAGKGYKVTVGERPERPKFDAS